MGKRGRPSRGGLLRANMAPRVSSIATGDAMDRRDLSGASPKVSDDGRSGDNLMPDEALQQGCGDKGETSGQDMSPMAGNRDY
ncbi:hypothetical protein Dimus_030019 [Dionaea muscipula]